MRRFKIHGHARVLNGLARGRTDGTNHDFFKSGSQIRLQAELRSNPENMADLDSARKNGHLHFSRGHLAYRVPQGSRVIRQCPAVNGHLHHPSTSFFKGTDKKLIGHTVFLNGHGAVLNRNAPLIRVQRLEDFMPGVRLRHGDHALKTVFVKRAHGLGPAGHQRDGLKRLLDFFERVFRGKNFYQHAGAHAGHKNHHVDLPAEKTFGKTKNFGIFFQGDFLHGRRADHFPAVPPDAFGHGAGHAALEQSDPRAGQLFTLR